MNFIRPLSSLEVDELSLKLKEILKDLDLKQIQRWTIFSIVIGIVSGFGAVLFYLGLSAFSNYILGGIGG